MEDEPGPSWIQRILKPFTKRRQNSVSEIEKDLHDLIDEGEERGILSLDEGDMIHGILELGDTFAREIMVPRIEIVGIRENATLQEIIELTARYGYSRYPVFRENLDHIEGVLHVKDILKYWGHDIGDRIVHEVRRPAFFVAGNKPVNELLRIMRDEHVHLAVVTDEYGGTAGLLTIEDIIEEIVGEIHDEHDHAVQLISILDENTYIVDARTDIEDLEESLGVTLPEGDYGSVGGFIIHLLGKMPKPSEEVRYKDLTFTIQSADPRRIERVKVARQLPSHTS